MCPAHFIFLNSQYSLKSKRYEDPPYLISVIVLLMPLSYIQNVILSTLFSSLVLGSALLEFDEYLVLYIAERNLILPTPKQTNVSFINEVLSARRMWFYFIKLLEHDKNMFKIKILAKTKHGMVSSLL
jgi:hypothetical protein